MQFHFFTFFALFCAAANSESRAQGVAVERRDALLGEVGSGHLNHAQVKRFTMPNLVPTTTVKLESVSTGTTTGTPTTTRAFYGQTTVTLSTGKAQATGDAGEFELVIWQMIARH